MIHIFMMDRNDLLFVGLTIEFLVNMEVVLAVDENGCGFYDATQKVFVGGDVKCFVSW